MENNNNIKHRRSGDFQIQNTYAIMQLTFLKIFFRRHTFGCRRISRMTAEIMKMYDKNQQQQQPSTALHFQYIQYLRNETIIFHRENIQSAQFYTTKCQLNF